MKKQLYKIKEAAEILGVSYTWLDRAVREGRVASVWIGGHRAIPAAILDEIAKNGVSQK